MMKQDVMNMDGVNNLINGIVVLASKDYMKAIKQLNKSPNSKVWMGTLNECEEFFLSDYYKSLTSVDGEWLIRKLREEASKV